LLSIDDQGRDRGGKGESGREGDSLVHETEGWREAGVGWYKGREDILEIFAILLGPIVGGGHDWNVYTNSDGYDFSDEHTQLQIGEGGDL